ncbi:MAG: DMT family transporter [Gammaproteobacteria bacterium]
MLNVHIKLVLMGLMWATSYPLGRWLASYEAPQAIVALRALVAFGFLACIAWRRRELAVPFSSRLTGHFLLLGFCGFCLHNFLMFEALEHTRANTGAVINGAIPVVVMTLDYLVFRRTIARAAVAGVAASFIGAVIVVTHGRLVSLVDGSLGYGELLFLIAITGWSCYSIIARPLLERLPALAVTTWACLAGAVLMLPWMFVYFEQARALLADPVIVVVLLVQGILTMGLGFLWYYEGIRALGPMNASVYINLVPVFGVALAAVTIGELPDLPLLIGGAGVVGGLLVVNRAEARRLARLRAAAS